MKITKKYLEKIIKEELKALLEQSYEFDSKKKKLHPAEDDIVAAVEAGFKAYKAADGTKISIRNTRVTDARLYRGSGTGFTVEFDADIGAIR